MKKRLFILTLTLYMCVSLAGCGSKKEQQCALRDEGIALMEAGDSEGAIDRFNQALGLSIGKVGSLEIDINYYKAAACVLSGDYYGAIGCYNALINYDDSDYKAYFMRGSVYAKGGDVPSAVDDYNKALTLHRKDYELYIEIFENFQALGLEEQGKGYLDAALEISSRNPEAYYYRGRIYYLKGEYENALSELNVAIKDEVSEAKLYAAKVYQALGDETSAQKLLVEYANSDEISSEALLTLGEIEMNQENYSGALDYFKAGLDAGDDDMRRALLRNQIIVLERLRRFSEAKEVAAQYVVEFPDDTEAANEYIFLTTR
ncbi:MAG: tetratricopeptide repeat protein [Bacteroidaceae bacterium]|nr:tetratricopeptide repeat protein [Bacteroidaceae bacterium]